MISLVQFKEDFAARTKMLDWVGGWLSQTRPIPRYLTVIMKYEWKDKVFVGAVWSLPSQSVGSSAPWRATNTAAPDCRRADFG